jgi:putative ABC transport system permease protein
MIMGKVTLRNLASHKLRLALTGLSVILGVAFIAGTLIFTDTITHSFDSLFSRDGKDFAVQVEGKKIVGQGDDGDSTQNATVPGSYLTSLKQVDGVKDATGHVEGYAAIVGANGKVVGGSGPPQIGTGWTGGPDDKVVSGTPPQTPTQVALDVDAASKAGLKTGDQVKVLTKGKPQTFTVSGIVDYGALNGATVTSFSPSIAQQLLLKPGEYTTISLTAQPGVSPTALRDRVAKALPSDLTALTGDQVRKRDESDLNKIIDQFRTFLLVFAGISMFVGAFIIFNTFTMLMAQRSRELALLRAVGASRKQVTRTVLGEAIGVGFVGSTLGLGLGIGIAAILQAVFKSQGLDLKTGLYFGPNPFIWSYAVGIIVTVVAAYFPARRGAKIPPVAAMRDDVRLPQRSMKVRLVIGSVMAVVGAVLLGLGVTGTGSQPLALLGAGAILVFLGVTMLAPVISTPVVKVLGSAYPRLFRTPGRLAHQNAQRNPRRTATTAAALMIGLSLVTMVNVIGASLTASFNKTIDEQFGADYLVSTSGGGQGFSATVADEIAKVPGVQAATAVYAGNMKIGTHAAAFESGDTAALVKATKGELTAGSTDLGSDGILVDQDTAKAQGYKVGTTIPVTFNVGGPQTLTVKGIYKKNQFLGPRIIALPAYKAHVNNPLAVVTVIDAGGKQSAATKSGIETALKDYPNLKVQDQTGFKADTRKQIEGFVTFLTIMLILSIIIAGFGVINTIALSVIERTREIGLLRAVGTSRRQVRRMIRLEAVVIAVFGGLLGVALGLAFGAAVQQGAKDDGISVLSIPFGTLIVYVVVAGVIGVLAALWPAWRAGRMDVLKAISSG